MGKITTTIDQQICKLKEIGMVLDVSEDKYKNIQKIKAPNNGC